MAINYLYIDDDSSDRANGTVQGFKKGGHIEVFLSQPESTWEQQIQFIEGQQKEDKLDGLIIDLRLDDYANVKDGAKANYRGTSLAQEIRTRQKEGSIKEFPIILFSANDKVLQSLENSGRDLFDICIEKDSITNDEVYEKTYIPKLYGLADGYNILRESKGDLPKILSVDINIIDERFVSELTNLMSNPPHVVARFLINELLLKQGLLIDELTLAARLGIDIVKSGEDWKKVLSSLNGATYKGIFWQGWQRWWMPVIEKWWNDIIHAEVYLRSIPAPHRIELIQKELGLKNIYPATKIDKADSEDFWTVCRGHNLPLDPIDGLMIEGQENLYPWQEPDYVSIDAALNKKNVNSWKKVAKLEEERLKELQEQFRKVR